MGLHATRTETGGLRIVYTSASVEFTIEDGELREYVEHTQIIVDQAPAPRRTRNLGRSQWVKAGEYLRARRSKIIEGNIPLAVLDYRTQCCTGKTLDGKRVNDPCASLETTDAGLFCTSCGCGRRGEARIDSPSDDPFDCKLAFPDLECPASRFGRQPGERWDKIKQRFRGLINGRL